MQNIKYFYCFLIPPDTSKLKKQDQKKLNGAFDPSAQTQFSGGAMFDTSGNISQAFLDIFDQDEKKVVEELQGKYKDGKMPSLVICTS